MDHVEWLGRRNSYSLFNIFLYFRTRNKNARILAVMKQSCIPETESGLKIQVLVLNPFWSYPSVNLMIKLRKIFIVDPSMISIYTYCWIIVDLPAKVSCPVKSSNTFSPSEELQATKLLLPKRNGDWLKTAITGNAGPSSPPFLKEYPY